MEVKVIDFGLAKAIAGAGGRNGPDPRRLRRHADLRQSGTVCAARPADARSDIYSLGVTLWYALTGEVPYPGKTIEEIRVSRAQVALPVEQLVARKVPAPVIKLICRILATDPGRAAAIRAGDVRRTGIISAGNEDDPSSPSAHSESEPRSGNFLCSQRGRPGQLHGAARATDPCPVSRKI